jgi:hypothetical protein
MNGLSHLGSSFILTATRLRRHHFRIHIDLSLSLAALRVSLSAFRSEIS